MFEATSIRHDGDERVETGDIGMRGLLRRQAPAHLRRSVITLGSTNASLGSLAHQPQLDGVRAVAIVLVFIGHAGLQNVLPGGFGVTMFFFLSGYLITTLLRCEMLATDGISLRKFYMRRALRILPPLYLTMAFAVGLHALGALSGPLDGVTILAQAVFLSNYADVIGLADGLPLPLWSLAVEEHFYFLFPVVFSIALSRMNGSRAAAICLIACLSVLLIRVVSLRMVTDPSSIYYWTHTRIDSIIFGCCLALWRNPLLDGPAAYWPRKSHVIAALIVLVFTLCLRDEAFRQTLRYSLQSSVLFVLFAAILAPADTRIIGIGWIVRLLSGRMAGLIGLYSYTIYLVHFIMLDLAGQVAGSVFVRGLLGLALSILYAAVMYRFVERPAARLRRRLEAPSTSLSRPVVCEEPAV